MSVLRYFGHRACSCAEVFEHASDWAVYIRSMLAYRMAGRWCARQQTETKLQKEEGLFKGGLQGTLL